MTKIERNSVGGWIVWLEEAEVIMERHPTPEELETLDVLFNKKRRCPKCGETIK